MFPNFFALGRVLSSRLGLAYPIPYNLANEHLSLVDVQVITTLESFLSLKKDWNDLVHESGMDSVFFRHEWFVCCWRRLEQNCDPWILIVRKQNAIIAVAPLVIRKITLRGLPARAVGFLENPDTPIADIIIRENEPIGLEGIIDALVKNGHRWDLMLLQKMTGESKAISGLETVAKKNGLYFSSEPSGQRWMVKDAGTWESYLNGKSARFRKTLRNVINRLEKLGTVSVEHHTHPDDLDRVLADAFTVSGKSWKTKLGLAITNQRSVEEFFRSFSSLAMEEGWLDLWVLKVDGNPVSMEYDLVYNGKVWALRSDFDETMKNYSPGAYLNYFIAKHFLETGLLEYDMGLGANEYKLRWANHFCPVTECHIYNSTIYGRSLFFLEERLIPAIRSIRQALRSVVGAGESKKLSDG